ncbi:hypothetical protein FSARC_9322 [Fusarium sarcochroum]|uniref:Methyltransferase n=1 Tax=Fusarium sarcochroum TaxID=1208366 RepID=A0A8H4TRG9_9HYPO|nr:hypothetical protein FSARC_9322 [Fusarium sarcochroum]
MAAETAQATTERPVDSNIATGVLEADHGRRYHAFHEGTYLVPNDDEEQGRMDLVHHIYSLLLEGKLHTAPIGDSPQRVLDLGTGTGIWAIDFADEHSSAEVIGTDLSPIQPDWIPANCVFEVDDFEDPWVYKKPFDYIHARELEGCIADEDKFFQSAFQNLNSGGYLELQAMRGYFMSDDDSIKNAKNAEAWAVAIRESSTKFGKPIDCVTEWKDKLIKAGFEDVHQKILKLPVGSWPKDPVLKEIGKCQLIQSCLAIDSYTPMLVEKVHGWTKPLDTQQLASLHSIQEKRSSATVFPETWQPTDKALFAFAVSEPCFARTQLDSPMSLGTAVTTPAPYGDVGATEANKKLRRFLQRFFNASGQWPADWLPLDYKPRPPAFGQNAAESLVIVVEAVCSPDSGVTMDELRDFLVNKAKEHRSKSKTGKPLPPRMKADCKLALKWVINCASETRRVKMIAENEANAVYDSILKDERGRKAAVGEELGDEVARGGQQSNTSEISLRGTSYEDHISISDSDTEPSSIDDQDIGAETLSPTTEETTSKRKRSIAGPPGVTKRSRHADDPDGDEDIRSAETPSTTQNDTVSLFTIDRDMKALESHIWGDNWAINILVETRDKIQDLANSLDIQSADQALLQATQDLNKVQEEFNQMQNFVATIAAVVQGYGDSCSDTILNQHNDALFKRDEAEKKRDQAKDYLEEQRRAKDSIESSRREKLEHVALSEENIRVLLTRRTLLGIVGSENLHIVAELDDLHKLGSKILDKVRDHPSDLSVPERS